MLFRVLVAVSFALGVIWFSGAPHPEPIKKRASAPTQNEGWVAEQGHSAHRAAFLMREVSLPPPPPLTEAPVPTSVFKNSPASSESENDPALDVQIDWPETMEAKRRVFDMLYDCVGMRVGRLVANEGEQSASKLVVQQNVSSQLFSSWIRVSQGALTSRELSLLETLGQEGVNVRLFPRSSDRLWRALFTERAGYPSLPSQIRGQYSIKPSGLYIQDIKIDGQLTGHLIKVASLC